MSRIAGTTDIEGRSVPEQQRRTVLAAVFIGGMSLFALCLLLASGEGAVGPLDRHVLNFVITHRGQRLIDVVSSIVALGEVVPLLTICALWGAVVLVPDRPRVSQWRMLGLLDAAVPVLSLLSTAFVVWLTKVLVDRIGPAAALRGSVRQPLAFPSGHAALSAAVLFSVAFALTADARTTSRLRLVIIGFAVTLALTVSYATVALVMHWPTDALGGTAIGVAMASLVLWSADQIRRRCVVASSSEP